MPDWIAITPARMAIDSRADEVDALAKERLAEQVQTQLRGVIDPGIDRKRARRAQAVRSNADGGRIVIREEDQGQVLNGVEVTPAGPSGIERLFEPSSGIPTIDRDTNGNTRAVFRSVEAGELFGQSKQETQDSAIRRTVTNAIGTNLVDVFTDVIDEVERRHPESKY
jgi:hypothetical protein